MPMNPRLLRPTASGFNPRQISGLALWLDAADSQSLYTTDAGPVAAVSSPLDIAGCVGWWDASDATTITESGGLVSQLSDKSGQGNHATASGALRPTLTASGLNGLSVLNFDGTQGLQGNLASSVVSNAYSVFVVCRVIGGITNGRVFSVSSAAGADFGSGLVIPCLSNGTNLSAFSGTAGANVSAVAGFSSYAVFGGVLAANQVANAANGMSGTSGSATLSATITRFGIGIAAQGGTGLNTADIAEIIYYPSALSTADRARVEAYLAAKWGIANVHTPATAASQPVGYWGDRSGSGLVASTTDATKRPVIASLNGRNALDFDGSNDNLIIQGYTAENGLTGLTRYGVMLLDANVSAISITNSNDGIIPSGGARFVEAQSGTIGFVAGNTGFTYNSVRVANPNYTLLREAARVLGVTYDGSKATVEEAILAHYNGATLPPTSTAGSVISPLAGGGTRLHIGSNVNANNWWNGLICEYLVYTRTLTASERRKVETYLAAKWGITLAPQVSNPDAQDWISRVYANGGSVSTSTANAVNTFCDAINAAGLRDRFYRLNLFCGNSDASLNAVRTPLYRGPSLGGTQYGNALDTNNNFVAGDYAETGASGGLLGNGSSKYLNTGLPMDYATASGLANSDRHLAVYKNAVATGTHYSISVVDSGAPLTLYQLVRVGSNNSYFSGGNTTSAGAADNTGLWVGTGTVSRVLYRNGTSVASNATGSDTVNAATRPFFVFAQNNSGSAAGFSNERQSAYSIGASMTATQVSDYYTALQAFQTALGRNV